MQNSFTASGSIVRWCLISHTNIGKTSLSRTLLGQDIGDIRDEAHVTDSADEYVLLKTQNHNELRLWDTPGFGDSVRLQARLAQHGNPLGWFLSNVWDRWRDKPFWMSQKAMQAARDHADVILYVVNAAEAPQETGYLKAELQILEWLQKPVIVLINQLGTMRTAQQEKGDLMLWQAAMQPYHSFVQDVLVLDAFSRSWLHEQALFKSMHKALSDDKQAAWQDIWQTWEQRNQTRLEQSIEAIANCVYFAASAQERVKQPKETTLLQAQRLFGISLKNQEKNQATAMKTLLANLEQKQNGMMQKLLALHQLDGKAAANIHEQLQDYFKVDQPIDAQKAGVWGAIASGAATGVGADLAAGGLTFGAGAAIGAIAGAITFAGAAWGLNQTQGKKHHSLMLSDAFLDSLLQTCLMQYLAISHYGRARGRFTNAEAPAHWQSAILGAFETRQAQWHRLWSLIREKTKNDADELTKAGNEEDTEHRENSEAEKQQLLVLTKETLQACMQQLYAPLIPNASPAFSNKG